MWLSHLETLSSLGLRGTYAIAFEEFILAINDRPAVLALIGHCDEVKGTEFSDGYKSIDKIVAEIPSGFQGVLDISVCKPTKFIGKAKAKAPLCAYRDTDESLEPEDWLAFYVSLFLNIGARGTYGAALIQTINEFNRQRVRSLR